MRPKPPTRQEVKNAGQFFAKAGFVGPSVLASKDAESEGGEENVKVKAKAKASGRATKAKAKASGRARAVSAKAKAKASDSAAQGEAKASGPAEAVSGDASRTAAQPLNGQKDEGGAAGLEEEERASPAAAQPLNGHKGDGDAAGSEGINGEPLVVRPAEKSMTLEDNKVNYEQGKITVEEYEFNIQCINARDEISHERAVAPTAETEGEQSTAAKTAKSEENITESIFGLAVAPPSPPQHLCKHCKCPLDLTAKGWRLLSKHPPTLRCPCCNSRHVTLTRHFGTWPLDEFASLTDEEQETFYLQVKDKGADARSVVDLLVDSLTKRRLAINRSSEKGAFLPLEVWKAQGWNTDVIEKQARPEDIEVNRLGMVTYRVHVHETEKSKIEEDVR